MNYVCQWSWLLAACHVSNACSAFVGMQAAHELFGVGRESIDLTFGGVTIVTAVVATLLGGWVLDRVGSSIKNAMLMNGTFWQLLCSAIAHMSCTGYVSRNNDRHKFSSQCHVHIRHI